MNETGERLRDVCARFPAAARRPKVVFVTNSIPGHDAGFEKSGHAHYLAGFVANFIDRGFEVVLTVPAPRVDFLALPVDALPYRLASPALRVAGGRHIVAAPKAAAAALAWRAYARLPRPLTRLGSGARTLVRRTRGYAHVLGTYLTESQRAFVRRTVAAERPDIVVFDGIFNVCGRLSEAPHWVITHEIKHQRAQSFHERGIAVQPANLSAQTERALLAQIGNIVAIHWDDGAYFERLTPGTRVVVVPVTMALQAGSARTGAIPGRCLFVGSGSFHNFDGIVWFLNECWPDIRRAVPLATLDIYGTVCYRLGRLPAGVTAHGVAHDLQPAYDRAALAIVPLRIGSGLKVKLVEALAHGVPVVTTPIGAQGLTAFEPQPFLVADSAAGFAAQCVRLMGAPEVARDLTAAALSCARSFTPENAFADFAAATVPVQAVAPDSPAVGAVRICVAIPTFRRLALLPQLFAGLAAQTIAPDAASVEVVLLDNDPAAAAAPFAARRRAEFGFTLHYEHVREPGLSMVRNRALEFAAGRYDYLAMLDDDEVPEPRWLAELVRVARGTRAEVVVGPVFPVLPPDAPAWIVDLRALETPVHPDGERLREGWSCNALVSLSAIRELGVSFDPALNFVGGEDQLFFRQMVARGASIAFAAGAVVWESIAPERLTVRFNLERAYRRGNSLSFCDRRMNASFAGLAVRAAKGIAKVSIGLLCMPAARIRSEEALMVTACQVANGLGMLAGLMGKMHAAYRRTEPEPGGIAAAGER